MSLFRRVTRLSLILCLGGFFLMGSRCNYTPRPKGHSGPSRDIPPSPFGTSSSWFVGSNQPDAFQAGVLAQINAQRASQGASPLFWHDGLAAVASVHVADMIDNNYLGLIAPGGYDVYQMLVGADPSLSFDDSFAAAFQATGGGAAGPVPKGKAVGWTGFATSASQIAAMMSDPDIASALMDPGMTHYGIAVASGTFCVIVGKNVRP